MKLPSSTKPRSSYLALIAALVLLSPPRVGAQIPDGGYSFTPTAKEADLYVRIRDHALQQRVQMVLDPRLCAAARNHAADMQARRYFAHRNPDGVEANQRAMDEGYPLPSFWDPAQNYMESIAGSSSDTAADVVARWKKSAPHADHVFGKLDFYRGQIVVGVGQAPRSGLGYATYVFLSAPAPEGQNASVVPPAGGFAGTVSPAADTMEIAGLPEGAIFEVWIGRKTGKKKTTLTLNHVQVVDATGVLPLGPPPANRGFFQVGHLVP